MGKETAANLGDIGQVATRIGTGVRHGSLFSGIGGFDLAAEWCGWENVFHCEWNPFGQRVLKHYWPNAESYDDITKTDFTKWRGTIDIVSGGFPCQPYSTAGKRKGKEDERHLWPEMLRAIREIAPSFVVGENVRGLVNWNGGMVFNEVQTDLELTGYEVAAVVIPAAGVNAPHGRDRVWFVAKNASRERLHNGKNETGDWRNRQFITTSSFGAINETFGDATDTQCNGLEHGRKPRELRQSQGETRISLTRHFEAESWARFPTESPICGGNDGLSTELDGITFSKWRNESIKAYGNAIVPQVAYQIFKTIQLQLQQQTQNT